MKFLPFVTLSFTFASIAHAAPMPETIGGGTAWAPAVGPSPSFEIGGKNMVLVKNWDFGTDGTIQNYADMSANFFYHDQFGTINNGGKYGSNTVAPDAANAVGGQPIEGVNSPSVREIMQDSLKTFLTPLDGTKTVKVSDHNAGNGSFMAKWRLPRGGSLLGRDIVWETRVRYKTPPYYWFAIWTAGNKWKWDGESQGAEHDLVEGFGYDNGGGNTNYDGRFWHSNSVASPSKDAWNFWDWGGTMKTRGIENFDPLQYHTWTWHYKKDNSFAMYMDGVLIQKGVDYWWTFGNKKDDEPIDIDFLFDGGWGHNQIGSVNKEMPASEFEGKFYEWDYSRVYLSDGVGTARNGPHVLPGTIKAADFNRGAEGVAFGKMADGTQWRNYTVEVPTGGAYQFSFQVAAKQAGARFHLEDETGANLTGILAVPKTGLQGARVNATKSVILLSGAHALKWVQEKGDFDLLSLNAVQSAGAMANFVKIDEKTQGSWKGVYGADGYILAGDAMKLPDYATFKKTGWDVTWNGATDDVRALQKADKDERVAGQWGTNDPSYDFDVNLTDGALHQVAIYGLDWDRNGRNLTIQVLDAESGKVLDTRDLQTYVNGKYLLWSVRGHVVFHLINASGWTNPALSGVFFDAPGAKLP